jgi:preprotein translocase subunit SecG
METAILIFHVAAALGIIGLVLLQHGKGADVGAAFGSGASGSASVFGSAGSANFLSRATAVLALIFFLTSLGLTYFSVRKPDTEGVMSDRAAPVQSLPAQVPGQGLPPTAPGMEGLTAPAAPSPSAPAEAGKVQDVPK